MKLRLRYLTLSAVMITLCIFFAVHGVILAAPVFTGDAAADFTSPAVIKISDMAGDVGMPLPDFPAGTRSGWDMRTVYLEYDQAADTMYVGIDCIVICGDADNDGDPNTTGPILGKPVSQGGLGGKDVANFGAGESFGLLIDTNNDFAGGTGGFEVVIGVKNSDSLANIGAYAYTGNVGGQLRDTGWGAKLPNPVTLFAPTSATTPDLEFSIANFSTLPGFPVGQPIQSYKLQMAMGSIVDDGIGEDYAPDQLSPVEITPTPPPTVPATETPTTLPTDTPTVTPTVPAPTETATVAPTETPTALPTDTPTMLPPTSVPTTGADLSQINAAAVQQIPVISKLTANSQPAMAGQPTLLEIPAIHLSTAVETMGWQRMVDANGVAYSEWENIEFAAGWQKNSALPGSQGNVVLSGHNNIEGAVFRDLWKLTAGQQIHVYANNKAYTYLVDTVKLMPETNASADQRIQTAAFIRQSNDFRLTLVSCWPPNNNTHRVFVTAHLIRPSDQPMQAVMR
ncbi:MAG: sortase [Chloroflexi bacterium]|nr:sortase [Chloroflexota bacterium]